MARNSAGYSPAAQNEGEAVKLKTDGSSPPSSVPWYSFYDGEDQLIWWKIVLLVVFFLIGVGLIVWIVMMSMGSISFDKSLETQYVTPGVDEYRVKCVATTSNSKLDIKYGWKIDDGDPAQISRDEVRMEDNGETLILIGPNQFRDEDRNFTCLVFARDDEEIKEEKQMSINIRFKRPPRFVNYEDRPNSLILAYEETGSISCEADAQPPASWKWKCGGIEVNKAHPNWNKFSIDNSDENKSTLKVKFIPELFPRGRGGCFCFPENEMSKKIISLGTNVTEFYPPVLFRPATISGTTAKLSTYRDESKGPEDVLKCFFVQYKKVKGAPVLHHSEGGDDVEKVEENEHDGDDEDNWKFASRIWTNADSPRRCTISGWRSRYVSGFDIESNQYRDLYKHLHVVGSAQFEIHGLKPNTQYEARAMVVLANDNIGSSVKFSDKIGFTSGKTDRLWK